MPLPKDADDQRLDALAGFCSTSMESIADEIGVTPFPEGVTPDTRKYLAMRLFFYCLFNLTKGREVDASTKARIDAYVADVRRDAEASCKGVERMFHERPFNAIASTWRPRYVRDSGTPGL